MWRCRLIRARHTVPVCWTTWCLCVCAIRCGALSQTSVYHKNSPSGLSRSRAGNAFTGAHRNCNEGADGSRTDHLKPHHRGRPALFGCISQNLLVTFTTYKRAKRFILDLKAPLITSYYICDQSRLHLLSWFLKIRSDSGPSLKIRSTTDIWLSKAPNCWEYMGWAYS